MSWAWRLGIAALLLSGVASAWAGAAGQGGSARSGFRALSGAEARNFVVPPDMRPVTSFHLDTSRFTYERYQQYFGAAQVLGAQITLYRNRSGVINAVIGSHYPGIVATSVVGLPATAAGAVAEREVGAAEHRRVDLMIDPRSGRYFFRVESRGFASRWFHWIDAASGRVLNQYDAIESGGGTGVKGDTKGLTGLTTFDGSGGHGNPSPHYDAISADGRQVTYDTRNTTATIYDVTDSDDVWSLVTADRRSPGQPALVDAHYYANVTDDYLNLVHGLDWTADCGYPAMQSVAHFGLNYTNAFWDGAYTVYGDGDGVSRREFSAGLDVVGHEHGHGVTDCTSNLIYQNQSGALNESFSDIMGNSAEFFANEPSSSNCVRATGQTECADWWIAEDVSLASDTVPGFRNMADPEEDADPDHYSEYIVTAEDEGGVHSNSGIPNHAFYLLVNGGQNAGCDAVGSNGHTHSVDCDVTVAGIGVADAQRIFFLGFTALPSNATMCNARTATEAAASALFGPGSQQARSTTDVWLAVGLTNAACGLPAPTPTPTPTFSPTPTSTPTPMPTATPTPTPASDTDGDTVPDSDDPDDDGDGYWDSEETTKGSAPLNALSTPEHCDAVDNDGDTAVDEEPAGADWDIDGDMVKDCSDATVDTDGDGVVNTVDPDDDGDGYADSQERYMTTDELGSCPTGLSHDAWPPDRNGDADADVGDVIASFMGKILKPLTYDARSDPTGDGANTIGDVISLYFGKVLTKCAVFTFTNGTGGPVDDIHIVWTGPIGEIYSAVDSGLAGWVARTLSPDGLTLDIDRADAQGDLANGGQLTIIVRALIPVPAISSCRWTLDGVDEGPC